MNKVLSQKQIAALLNSYAQVHHSYPFEKQLAVYYYSSIMFAVIDERSDPLKISLLIDPQLGSLLHRNYETIMPAKELNPKKWITLLLTGQLENQEVQDLIRHAYEQAKSNANDLS